MLVQMDDMPFLAFITPGVLLLALAIALAGPPSTTTGQTAEPTASQIDAPNAAETTRDAKTSPTEPLDFARDIVPILTRAGCNSGACHGAAAGRGYLTLSLYGSRPVDDYQTLLHKFSGRFIDWQSPRLSRLLQKPSGYVQHGGGVRIDDSSRQFELIEEWIAQGAHLRTGSTDQEDIASNDRLPAEQFVASPVELEVSRHVLACEVGDQLTLATKVRWNDGRVTPAANRMLVEGADQIESPVLTARKASEPEGIHEREQRSTLRWWLDPEHPELLHLASNAPGYWPVTLRFGPIITTLQIWVRERDSHASEHHGALDNSSISESRHAESHDGPTNAAKQIDPLVNRAVARLGVEPATSCEPHLLARRLWLDLLGKHPPRDQWQRTTQRLQDGELPQVVDELLGQKAFHQQAADMIVGWTYPAAMPRGQAFDPVRQRLSSAVAEALDDTDDLRELARAMLCVDEVNKGFNKLLAFHQLSSEPRQRSELVASTWLGVRIGCAKCHDHPLDHWTQDDYFALAACWAEIEFDRQKGQVRRIRGKTTTDLRTGRPAKAQLPGEASLERYQAISGGKPARHAEGKLDKSASEAGTQSVADRQAPEPTRMASAVSVTSEGTPADRALIVWLCDSRNDLFARNLVHRVWYELMGLGIIDEVDDQRATNPPLNPELLSHLVDELRQNDFSLRHLIRSIVLSETYARRSDPSASQLILRLGVARAARPIDIPLVRLVTMALTDDLLDEPNENASHEQTMMMEQVEPNDCLRNSVCAEDTFSQSLQLVAGRELNQLLEQVVADRLDRKTSPRDIWSNMHQDLFGQQPSAEQLDKWQAWLDDQATDSVGLAAPLEDLLWSWVVDERFRQLH